MKPIECWIVEDMGGTSVQYTEPTRDADDTYLDQVSSYAHFIEFSAYVKLRKDLEAESDVYFEQNKIMREALEEISIECDIEVNEDRREHNHGPTEAATTAREALEKCGSTEPMRKIIAEAILNLDGQQARNKDNV